MKKTLLIIAIAASLGSCKKEKQATPGMFGTWELRRISGGWGVSEDFKIGNGNKYLFTGDSSYVKYKDNAVENQGTFSLSIIAKERGFDVGSIKFTKPAYTDAFQIKQDTMYLGSSAADGPTYLYIKQK